MMFAVGTGLIFFIGRIVASSSSEFSDQPPARNPGYPWSSIFEQAWYRILSSEDLASGLWGEAARALDHGERLLARLNDPAFEKLTALYETRELGSCASSELAADLGAARACFCITADFANLTETLLNAGYRLAALTEDLVADLGEINDCAGVPFYKRVQCYIKAFGDTQEIVKQYAVALGDVVVETSAAFTQLDVDVYSCFHGPNATALSDRLERNIALCKLKLI